MAPSDIKYLSHPCIYGDCERKSRFMKWLSKLFKGGSSVGRRVRGPSSDETMLWQSLDDPSRARKENAELAHAAQPSLTEDSRRQSGHRWRRDHDKELTRAPHDAFNSPFASPPKHTPRPHPYNPHHPPHFPSHHHPLPPPPPLQVPQQHYPWGYKICGGCKREIRQGNYLGCMGTYFHPPCFRCHACDQPITENEFSLSGRAPYHKACFKELAHPKCDVCHQFIPANRAGLIEYRCHPFWQQKYCPSHEHDNTPRCCSCERLESSDARYVSLGDGRSLCFECMESAIMDTGDCQPLYHAIRDYYEGMHMKIDQQIPMLLVERQALNEAIVGEKCGLHQMPETRGLCLSEEQIVTSIQRRPRFGGHQLIGIRTQPQKLTRKCEVTAILVLYGLPRLLTGAILAHELMHGWLRLKGFRNLNPEVEEGICQVLSNLWLESEVMPGSRNIPSTSAAAASSSSSSSSKKGGNSNVESKLGEFFMHQITHDNSLAYGEGFRAANAAVNKYGLRRTLDHIRFTGSFPL